MTNTNLLRKKLDESGNDPRYCQSFRMLERGEIMAYDYAKLNGRIIEKCGTQAIFAKRMGLSERTISMKLNNKIAFKQPEIQKALEVLNLASDEIQAYFFTIKVQNN